MGKQSSIEWTDATWNPWRGCTKVSPGCAHCYMFRDQTRYGHDPAIVVRSKTTFDEPRRWADPQTVFTCSWSDWFHEDADPWRDEAWAIIRETPRHLYLILTKRPEMILDRLPLDWGEGWPNVWLGVSVESNRFAYRATTLVHTPAAGRFVSAEPLLAPVRFEPGVLRRLDWVIVGGESGPDRRPMELQWARGLRDDCGIAGVPFFLKQLGGWPNKRGGVHAMLDGCRHTDGPRWPR